MSERGKKPVLSPSGVMLAFELAEEIYFIQPPKSQPQRIDRGRDPQWLGNNSLVYQQGMQVVQHDLRGQPAKPILQGSGAIIIEETLATQMRDLISGKYKTLYGQTALASFGQGRVAFSHNEMSISTAGYKAAASVVIVNPSEPISKYPVVSADNTPLGTINDLAVSPSGTKAAFTLRPPGHSNTTLFLAEFGAAPGKGPVVNRVAEFPDISGLTFWDDATLFVSSIDVQKTHIRVATDRAYVIGLTQLDPDQLRMMKLDESIANADTVYRIDLKTKQQSIFSSGHHLVVAP